MKKLFFIFLALLCFAAPCFAENFYIKNYDVSIQVSRDNSYHIKETIQVYFTNPSHGIFRTIPLSNKVRTGDGAQYMNRAQIKNFSASDFVSESRSGGDITYKLGNPNRTIIGDKTYFLEYDYIMSARAARKNEFYFNIIGDAWNTTINSVNFSIFMPSKFDQSQIGFTLGTYGLMSGYEKIRFKSDGFDIIGEIIKPLGPNEALTIRIPLPENYFIVPHNSDSSKCSAIAILAALISFILWYFNGRDERIIPVVTFNPPKGLNSAEMGALYKDAVDSDCTGSLLLYLASKGYLKIETHNGLSVLTKLKEYNGKNLVIKSFFEQIFIRAKDGVMPIYSLKTSSGFRVMLAELENSLNNLRKKVYDKKSISFGNYLLPFLCSLLTLAIFFFTSNEYSFEFIERGGMLLAFPVIAIFALLGTFSNTNDISTKIFLIIWALGFGGIPAVILVLAEGLFSTIGDTSALISLVCFVVSVICTANMPRKNHAGRKILGEILGFKKYIETAELHTIQTLADEDPEHIHQILPYVYALGLDGVWLDKISQIRNLTTPDWYEGEYSSYSFSSYRTNTNDTISSARNYSNNSSSSSRSSRSGGGCSGGGSGGGGGGSW